MAKIHLTSLEYERRKRPTLALTRSVRVPPLHLSMKSLKTPYIGYHSEIRTGDLAPIESFFYVTHLLLLRSCRQVFCTFTLLLYSYTAPSHLSSIHKFTSTVRYAGVLPQPLLHYFYSSSSTPSATSSATAHPQPVQDGQWSERQEEKHNSE